MLNLASEPSDCSIYTSQTIKACKYALKVEENGRYATPARRKKEAVAAY